MVYLYVSIIEGLSVQIVFKLLGRKEWLNPYLVHLDKRVIGDMFFPWNWD